MMAMRMSDFTRYALALFAAPIIWAAHFLGIYGFAGVVCARPGLQDEWLGITVLAWGVLGAGVVAVAALALSMRARERAGAGERPDFLRHVSAGLAWLAVIAIVWESIAVLYFPGCGGGR